MKIQMYSNPIFYDLCTKNKKDDIPFYLYWANNCKGNILEIASGTGRIAEPLINCGYNYTGLDLSSTFIGYTQKKYSQENFICGDMRNFSLGQQFDLIILPFNSFLHLLNEKDMKSCLKSIKKHLSNDGLFILDIFTPDPEFIYRDSIKKYKEMIIHHPSEGKYTIWQTSEFDEQKEILYINWFFENVKKIIKYEYEFAMSIIYPDTMDRILTEVGFIINEKKGDYNGELFDENSLLQLYICSKT
tara:strand:- start:4162 stop:4896 length:735 start_codon:yes stop_codon:yes gene_type:complete